MSDIGDIHTDGENHDLGKKKIDIKGDLVHGDRAHGDIIKPIGDVQINAQAGSGSGNILEGAVLKPEGDLHIDYNFVVETLTLEEKSNLQAGAQTLFNLLPTDQVAPRQETALPAGSRLPFDLNPHFVGRETELLTLARALKGAPSQTIGETVAICGLGGLGKSQLAIEFAQRYGRYFAGGVYFINFENPDAIEAEIALCGQDLKFPGMEQLSVKEQAANVLLRWKEPVPILLICDNCENPELIDRWIIKTGLKLSGCRILITSRVDAGTWRRSGLSGMAFLELSTLERPDSQSLLRELVDDLSGGIHQISEEAADRIADTLGDLPLALHLAGSYIGVYEESAELYLAEWSLKHESMAGRGVNALPNRSISTVSESFALSWDKIVQSEPGELDTRVMVHIASFAPGEPIHRQLLLDALAAVDLDRKALIDSLNRLSRAGIVTIERSPPSVLVHRLIGEYVLDQADVEAVGQIRNRVSQFIQSEASRLIDQRLPLAAIPLQPHLRYQIKLTQSSDPLQYANLLDWLATHLFDLAEYEEAQSLFKEALAIYEAELGPKHPNSGFLLIGLADLYRKLGEFAAARPLYEEAVSIYQTELDDDHPHLAVALNNLGLLERAEGNLKVARTLHTRALEISEAQAGAEDDTVASSADNLALVLQIEGEHAQAEPLFARALKIRQAHFGKNHPTTATSLNNYAGALYYSGKYEEAQALYEQALEIKKAHMGPDHPETASAHNNLGFILSAQENNDGARTHYEQALSIRKTQLGEDHPDTALALSNLGTLSLKEGDVPEALRQFEAALAILESTVGVDHHNTKTVRGNIEFLRSQLDTDSL